MSKIILAFAIITLVTCTSRMPKTPESFKAIREKINECVLKNSTTVNLTKYVKEPGSVQRKDLSADERKILRNCAKQVISKKQTSTYTVLPRKEPDNRSINISNQPRKLSMLSGFSSFNILGIFTCIENNQPAIKLIRGAINMLKSMDYTSAVISIYDNFSTIGEAFSSCYNAIFPGN